MGICNSIKWYLMISLIFLREKKELSSKFTCSLEILNYCQNHEVYYGRIFVYPFPSYLIDRSVSLYLDTNCAFYYCLCALGSQFVFQRYLSFVKTLVKSTQVSCFPLPPTSVPAFSLCLEEIGPLYPSS